MKKNLLKIILIFLLQNNICFNEFSLKDNRKLLISFSIPVLYIFINSIFNKKKIDTENKKKITENKNKIIENKNKEAFFLKLEDELFNFIKEDLKKNTYSKSLDIYLSDKKEFKKDEYLFLISINNKIKYALEDESNVKNLNDGTLKNEERNKILDQIKVEAAEEKKNEIILRRLRNKLKRNDFNPEEKNTLIARTKDELSYKQKNEIIFRYLRDIIRKDTITEEKKNKILNKIGVNVVEFSDEKKNELIFKEIKNKLNEDYFSDEEKNEMLKDALNKEEIDQFIVTELRNKLKRDFNLEEKNNFIANKKKEIIFRYLRDIIRKDTITEEEKNKILNKIRVNVVEIIDEEKNELIFKEIKNKLNEDYFSDEEKNIFINNYFIEKEKDEINVRNLRYRFENDSCSFTNEERDKIIIDYLYKNEKIEKIIIKSCINEIKNNKFNLEEKNEFLKDALNKNEIDELIVTQLRNKLMRDGIGDEEKNKLERDYFIDKEEDKLIVTELSEKDKLGIEKPLFKKPIFFLSAAHNKEDIYDYLEKKYLLDEKKHKFNFSKMMDFLKEINSEEIIKNKKDLDIKKKDIYKNLDIKKKDIYKNIVSFYTDDIKANIINAISDSNKFIDSNFSGYILKKNEYNVTEGLEELYKIYLDNDELKGYFDKANEEEDIKNKIELNKFKFIHLIKPFWIK